MQQSIKDRKESDRWMQCRKITNSSWLLIRFIGGHHQPYVIHTYSELDKSYYYGKYCSTYAQAIQEFERDLKACFRSDLERKQELIDLCKHYEDLLRTDRIPKSQREKVCQNIETYISQICEIEARINRI